jgi:hypothetical protein
MKKAYQFICLMAGIVISGCIVGCCSTKAPQPAAARSVPAPAFTTNDLNITQTIEAKVTADQSFYMEGVKYQVPDIPAYLAKKKCEHFIVIIVAPESKLERKTLANLIDVLIKAKYAVALDPQSKYADLPVPHVNMFF